MRALEVVVLDEQSHAPLAVLEVRKHRARQELLPQGLPEALDLAAGLRVVWAALHVRNTVALELRLELGRPPPGGVLAPLVGQDLAWCTVVRKGARERLQHQSAPLVVRHRQAHQIARVIVEKCRHVQPLVPAQQEREQVRLPQLIGLGALEAHFLALRFTLHRCVRLDRALGLEHPLHRARRSAHPQKALHHIADAPAPSLRLRGLGRKDRCAARLTRGASLAHPHLHRHVRPLLSAAPIPLRPLQHRGVGHAKAPRRFPRRDLILNHRARHLQAHIHGPASSLCTCHLAALQGGVRLAR